MFSILLSRQYTFEITVHIDGEVDWCASTEILFVYSIVHSDTIEEILPAYMYLIRIIGDRGGGEAIRFGYNGVHKSCPYHLFKSSQTIVFKKKIKTRN